MTPVHICFFSLSFLYNFSSTFLSFFLPLQIKDWLSVFVVHFWFSVCQEPHSFAASDCFLPTIEIRLDVKMPKWFVRLSFHSLSRFCSSPYNFSSLFLSLSHSLKHTLSLFCSDHKRKIFYEVMTNRRCCVVLAYFVAKRRSKVPTNKHQSLRKTTRTEKKKIQKNLKNHFWK